MNELIERQATIDAVNNAFDRETLLTGFVRSIAVRAIRDMPSVQPVATDTNVGNNSEIPNSSDAVSRQAAIDAVDAIGHIATMPDGDKCIRRSAVKYTLSMLPSAQPEPQWIPVSERLPEDLSEVNVTWVNHNPEPYYEFTKDKPFTATAVYYKGKWYWYSANCVDNLAEYGRCDWDKVSDVIEIIAWMPLPSPYTK